MRPDEIINAMSDKILLLAQKNREFLDLSEKKAQAERAYNVTVATTTLRLKSEAHPATLIGLLCKGDKVVSELKYKFDVADGVYRACLESLKDIRTAIDTYRSMLSYEKEEQNRVGLS